MRLLLQFIVAVRLGHNFKLPQRRFRQALAAQPGAGQSAMSPQQQMPEGYAQVITDASGAIYPIEQPFQLPAREIVAPRLLSSLRQPERAVSADQAVFAQKAQQQPFELPGAIA